ncbi:MAG: hypothetical protein NTW87_27175 [Planctomycetota bacterium]|nr:hypothetical protein [Planctomycetota bacterium]
MGISKILWDRFQRWRLGDTWKPWQPTFDMPPEGDAKPQAPAFWPLLLMGGGILFAVLLLSAQSSRTFDGLMVRTLEESQPGAFLPRGFADPQRFDVRLVPVWLMLGIGLLQILGYVFLKYLAAVDNLPQGSIVETAKGQKQEVMQGNYIPFGPSLAAGALVVAFYDPLIRSFTYWWLVAAGAGALPLPAYRLLGQEAIIPLLARWVQWLNTVSTRLLEGG